MNAFEKEQKLILMFNVIMTNWQNIQKRRRQKMLELFRRRRLTLINRFSLQCTNTVNLIFSNIMVKEVPPEIMAAAFRYKRIWMKKKTNDYNDNIILENYTEMEWVENFRIGKETFLFLCEKLQMKLEPKPNRLQPRQPLSVAKQIAVALYELGNCVEYSAVGAVFGIHKSTVKKCVYNVVNAINSIIVPDTVCMPKELEAKYIAHQFEGKTNIPQLIGCIDATHIPIVAPKDGYEDYVIVQAVVDHNGRFRNVFVKFPKSADDASRVFKDSELYKHADSLIPQVCKNINGMGIPFMIVGSPAYPLLPWLIKECPGTVLSPIEESFNVYLNSARVTIEMGFGRLKGRWRSLLKRIQISYTFVPSIIVACCALHNLAEKNKDVFPLEWLDEVSAANEMYKQPSPNPDRTIPVISASLARNHLIRYMATNIPLE